MRAVDKKKKKKRKIHKIRLERAFLNFLVDSSSGRQVRALLKHITPQQYKSLQEIALNVIEGNLSFLSKKKYLKSAQRRLKRLIKGTLKKQTLVKTYMFLKPFILAALQFHDLR
jgi:hypothetical protein